MTDYKQLCAELIDALDSGIPSAGIRNSLLADRARAALAEPTDEELTEMFNKWWYSKGSALTPGGGSEEIRQITEIGWRLGCYFPDLPNPRLSRPTP